MSPGDSAARVCRTRITLTGTDEEPNSALQMFFKRTRIGRIARIALWALQLEVFKTTNTIGTTDTTVGDVVAGGLKEH